MKQSKFSLADVLTILTALAFGFICFLGKYFSTLGNTSVSLTWALIITVSLAGTVFIAKLLKRTSQNFKTNFILEIVTLALFTGLMVFFAYSSLPHYFNVYAKKKEIQEKLQTNITQAENMFTAYESYAINRENLYEGKLNAVTGAKDIRPNDYAAYGFENGSVSDDKQIKSKMFTIHSDLFPGNYSDSTSKNGIKEVAAGWMAKAKNLTKYWKPIGIVNVVNKVDINSKDWLNRLITFSQVREKGEQVTDFVYPLTFADVKTNFTALGKPTPLSISLTVGAYLLMLLSWFITKRHSRSTGVLTRVSYEVEL